ncbi:uncharacterized protein MONBRDRAFT_22722 [Monosiga brevicollis MX1]|uniref:Exostosin GT47 domain-containing protein n=1 Tax=Monosiga brevicollis TaxID=81824 RepID=A9URW2_MONBE|nr:uncharacterized protein MONBRDRAFT_22722 [Monosiga brevicollis MX1]EDQ91996.1 predicted protein [Monosiga brevicollis MX1]|eukprot:XP_001743282.1 hypothetical protein [Monosiga brevicollis MX1]
MRASVVGRDCSWLPFALFLVLAAGLWLEISFEHDSAARPTAPRCQPVPRRSIEPVFTNLTVEYNTAPAFTYDVIEGADVEGHDLANVRSNNVELLKQTCNALTECMGFNSNGWLKSKVSSRTPSGARLFVKLPLAAARQDSAAAHLGAGRAQVERLTHVLQPNINLTSLQEQALRQLRIFTYPVHLGSMPRAPDDYKYGVERRLPQVLASSPYAVQQPEEATHFLIPFQCTAHRYTVADRAGGQNAAEAGLASWIASISAAYPYWNRSAGANHFYVCSHDMGSSAVAQLSRAAQQNLIGLVNTADRRDGFFNVHRDLATAPHIGDGCDTCLQGGTRLSVTREAWAGTPRNRLAFMAGNLQRGPVRPRLRQFFDGDPDFLLVDGTLAAAHYRQALAESEFCLVVRGFRVWTPRLMDAVWSGCIPVIIADGYELPFSSLLHWPSFAVFVPEHDVPRLKDILLAKLSQAPLLRANLLAASQYLTYHSNWVPLDAFDILMLQLAARS